MIKKHLVSFVLVFTVAVCARAQVHMTLKQAVDSALKNNFDIRIARNDLETARVSNTPGNAGALPYLNASAVNTVSGNNTLQKTGAGTSTASTGENSLNAGISGGIVLFNGWKVVAARQRLSLLEQQGETLLNQQVQTTIADVSLKYYDIIRQLSYLKIIANSLKVSAKKLDIVKERSKVGMADAVDMLMAQTGLNSSQQDLRSQEAFVAQSKSDLFRLMNAAVRQSFTIDTAVVTDSTLTLESTLQKLEQNNQLLAYQQQVKISEQRLRETQALRYPSVKLTAGYSLMNNNYASGNTSLSRNYGPEAGLSFQIPLYNGHVYKTQEETARISLNTSKLSQEQLKQNLVNQAVKLHTAYASALDQIKLQRVNYALTADLVKVVLEKFSVNQATILEVNAAQASLESAGYQLINMQYSAKIAEIEIKLLTGSLTGEL